MKRKEIKKYQKMRLPLLILAAALLSIAAWATTRLVKGVTFKQQCSGYLERAANANTVEMAERELARAVEHLERNGIVTGYTSVLWQTPDEDVGFWYTNLSASLEELRSVDPDASQLERSNVLMKLRETLIDNGSEGDKLTAPEGVSVFPSNTAFFWWGWLTVGTGGLALCRLFYLEG